jgi:transposase-like protein
MKVKFQGKVHELFSPRTLNDLFSQVSKLFKLPRGSELECRYVNSERTRVLVFTDDDFSNALLDMGDRVSFTFNLLGAAATSAEDDPDLSMLVGLQTCDEGVQLAAIDNLAEAPVTEFRKSLLKRCTAPEFKLTGEALSIIGKIHSKEPSETHPVRCKQAMQTYFAGKRSKAEVIKEFDITPDKFNEWVEIFSSPSHSDFSLLCYPEEFAVEVMKDYLKGYYNSQHIIAYFALPIEVLYSWVRQSAEERTLQTPDPRTLEAVLAKSSLDSISKAS